MVSAIPQDQARPASLDRTSEFPKGRRWRRNDEDIREWAELFQSGTTILRIAKQYKVDPNTISRELHQLGLTITPGHHMVEQLPLRYSAEFIRLVDMGPDAVLEFVKNRVWGIQGSWTGLKQLRSFCEFVRLHHESVGVEEIARRLSVHRTTIAEWREGTNQPYLIRALRDVILAVPKEGWKALPMHLVSGGGEPSEWIQVPTRIRSYDDVLTVISSLRPLENTYERASMFGLSRHEVEKMRPELFAYLLGIMVGDSAKLGGEQQRYSSMNLDLQFTKKQPSNELLGEFVLLCANSLGLVMERKKDKPPTGVQLLGRSPTPAFRWTSERSPLLAWMFSAGLGLGWDETTTTDQLHMDWIYATPESFRIRFIQGSADSDGTTRKYVTDIATVPNAEFFRDVLLTLGVTTARIAYEKGKPLRTALSTKEASKLPLFNEFVKGYRYQRMMGWVGGSPSPSPPRTT